MLGSYNFASAYGHCAVKNWDDEGSEWAKPVEWKWEEVPAGAEPPEIVQATDNIFAFIPTVAGEYKLSVVLECKYSDKSMQSTVKKSFSTSGQKAAVFTEKLISEDNGKALEEQNTALYNIMMDKNEYINISYAADFNQDGQEETLVRYVGGGKWEMILFNDNKAEKLFSIATVGNSPIGSVSGILYVGHNEDGSPCL